MLKMIKQSTGLFFGGWGVFFLTNLPGNEGKGQADHCEHEQLTEPVVRGDVAVTNGGECDDHKVKRLKQCQLMGSTTSLYVLDSTDSVKTNSYSFYT